MSKKISSNHSIQSRHFILICPQSSLCLDADATKTFLQCEHHLLSKGTKREEMVFDHEGGNGFDFYFLLCIL